MQSRSTDFSIFFKFTKNHISSNDLCTLKTVFGDRNDFGRFEKVDLTFNTKRE